MPSVFWHATIAITVVFNCKCTHVQTKSKITVKLRYTSFSANLILCKTSVCLARNSPLERMCCIKELYQFQRQQTLQTGVQGNIKYESVFRIIAFRKLFTSAQNQKDKSFAPTLHNLVHKVQDNLSFLIYLETHSTRCFI